MTNTLTVLLDAVANLGQQSLVWFWAPVALWSIVAGAILFAGRAAGNPILMRPVLQQVITALPVGILASAVIAAAGGPGAVQVFQLPVLPESVATGSQSTGGVSLLQPIYLTVAFTTLIVLIVAIRRLALLVHQTIVTHRAVAALRLNSDDQLTVAARRLVPEWRQRHQVYVARSEAADVPFAAGWLRPVIVLPAGLEVSSQIKMALLHELAHIRRHHATSRWIMRAIRDAFWFHPLVARAYDTTTTLQECECDHDVLNRDHMEPTSYAGFLFAIADAPAVSRTPGRLIGTAFYSSPQQLTQRISAMKKMQQLSNRRSSLISGMSLLLVVGLMACSEVGTPDITSIDAEGPVTATMTDKIETEGVELPELIGGIQSLNVVYPRVAKEAGIEGRVLVSFEVDEQGNVVSTEIVRGIGGGADEEAARAIKEAKFKPATADGTPIRAKLTIPVTFKLEQE